MTHTPEKLRWIFIQFLVIYYIKYEAKNVNRRSWCTPLRRTVLFPDFSSFTFINNIMLLIFIKVIKSGYDFGKMNKASTKIIWKARSKHLRYLETVFSQRTIFGLIKVLQSIFITSWSRKSGPKTENLEVFVL